MDRYLSPFIFILIVSVNCYGQYGSLDWLSDFEKSSFDPATIRKNKITKVYVVETSGKRDVDGFAEKRDTVSIYSFDTNGNIVPETNKKDSSVIKVNITAVDSTILEYLFRSYNGGFDTSFILRKVYTKRGQLIEDQLTATASYLKASECGTGAFHHYKYDYDKSGRLVYYHDFKYWYYRRVHYTDYGKKIETYDFKTDKLLDTESILVYKVHDKLNDTWTTTETNRTRQVSKSYADNLLKIETTVTLGFFPTIKYIEYEYK